MHRIAHLASLILLVTTCSFAGVQILSHPLSPDSYLHLAVGKYIINHVSIPAHTDLSYKSVEPSLEFIAHSWLSDTIFYLIHSAHPSTLGIFLICLLLGAMYILWMIFDELHISPLLRYILLTSIPFVILSYWKAHPLTVATPLMLAMILVYIRWREKHSNILWVLPILFFFYANMAGGYIAIPFLVVSTLALIQIVLSPLLPIVSDIHLSLRQSLALFLVVSISFVVSLINPYQLLLYNYSVTIIAVLLTLRKTFSTLAGALKILNQSFIKDAASPLYISFFVLYLCVVVILFCYLTIKYHRAYIKKAFPFVPLLLVLSLSFLWIRFIPIVYVISLPFVALSIQFVSTRVSRTFIIAGSILSLGVLYGITWYLIVRPARQITTRYPDTQIKIMKNYALSKEFFTSPEYTGYLLYATDSKALLDAQDDLYDDQEAIHFYMYEPVIPETALKQIESLYGINTMLIDQEYGQLGPTLSGSDSWRLLYVDESGFLYAKPTTESASYVEENALTHIDLRRSLGFDPNNATSSAQELESYLRTYPNNVLAMGQLASIYRILHQFEKAESLLLRIPKDRWNLVVYTELGRLYGALGQCTKAESMFLKAIEEKAEMNFSRAILDLAVLYAVCFKDKEKARHYFQRYDSFILPPAERERVRQLIKEFGITLQE